MGDAALAGTGEGDVCFICLDGPGQEGRALVQVCACPRPVHIECLARWQLQQAGKSEERYCRFCNHAYPDWKDALTPVELRPSTPVMAVSVRGRVHKLRVRPGPEGKEDFKRQVRQLLGYDDDMEFDVIFECKTPHNGEKVQLHGFSAFDAATHCAAVSAAKRLRNKQHRHAADGSSSSSGGGSCSGGSSSGSSSSSIPVLPLQASLGSSSDTAQTLDQTAAAPGPSQQQQQQAAHMAGCTLAGGSSWGSGSLATVAEAAGDAGSPGHGAGSGGSSGQREPLVPAVLPPHAPALPPSSAAAAPAVRPSSRRDRSSRIPAVHAQYHSHLQRQTELYLAQQQLNTHTAMSASTAGLRAQRRHQLHQPHLHHPQQREPAGLVLGSGSSSSSRPGGAGPSSSSATPPSTLQPNSWALAGCQAGSGLSDTFLPLTPHHHHTNNNNNSSSSRNSSSGVRRAARLALGEANGEWAIGRASGPSPAAAAAAADSSCAGDGSPGPGCADAPPPPAAAAVAGAASSSSASSSSPSSSSSSSSSPSPPSSAASAAAAAAGPVCWASAAVSPPSGGTFAAAYLQAQVAAAGAAVPPPLAPGDSCSVPMACLGSSSSGSSLVCADGTAAAVAMLQCNALSEPLPACQGLQPPMRPCRGSGSTSHGLGAPLSGPPHPLQQQQQQLLGLSKSNAGVATQASVKKPLAKLVAWLKCVLPRAKQLHAAYTME